jgi:periplasmic divalent cation tolerance protein
MQNALLALTTVPDAEVGYRIAKSLVEAGVAACVTVLAPAMSVYRWQGQIESAEERVMLIKTTAERYPDLEQTLRGMHPYELPEILAVPVEAGLEPYLAWIDDSVRAS